MSGFPLAEECHGRWMASFLGHPTNVYCASIHCWPPVAYYLTPILSSIVTEPLFILRGSEPRLKQSVSVSTQIHSYISPDSKCSDLPFADENDYGALNGATHLWSQHPGG